MPKYYNPNSHTGIISADDFQKVQQLLREKNIPGRSARQSIFTRMLYCADCGTVFSRKENASHNPVWICRKHMQNVSLCRVRPVYEADLKSAFLAMCSKLQVNRKRVLEPIEKDLLHLRYAKIREVSEKTGVYGNIYHTWRSTVSLFGILDGKNTIIDGNYDFLKPYYEMILKEQQDGVVPNYGEQKTSGLHYSGAFENGQAAMCNMGSWFLATMQKYNAEASANGVQPVNFGIVKYPHPDGAPAGSTLGTVTSLAINANSTKKEAAADFLNWCASEEAAEALAATGNFPAVSSDKTSEIIASTDGFPNDENSKEALKTTAVYLEMPLSDKASEIETILNTEHDAIMTESETVDEGIANMNEQVQAILG